MYMNSNENSHSKCMLVTCQSYDFPWNLIKLSILKSLINAPSSPKINSIKAVILKHTSFDGSELDRSTEHGNIAVVPAIALMFSADPSKVRMSSLDVAKSAAREMETKII